MNNLLTEGIHGVIILQNFHSLLVDNNEVLVAVSVLRVEKLSSDKLDLHIFEIVLVNTESIYASQVLFLQILFETIAVRFSRRRNMGRAGDIFNIGKGYQLIVQFF